MRVWGRIIKTSFYLLAVAFLSTLPVAAQVVGPDGKTVGNIPIAGPNTPPVQLNIANPPAAPPPAPKPVQKSKTNKDIEKILGVGKAFIELNRQINNQNRQPIRVNTPQRQVAPNRGNRVVFYNASFKCRGKLNRTEYAICTNPQLARMDLIMADLYRQARRDGVPGVRKAQSKWRVNRNNRCGRNVNCLMNIYQERINALRASPPPRRVVRQAAPAPRPVTRPVPTNRYSRLVSYKCSNGAGFSVRYEGDSSYDAATLVIDGIPDVRLDGQPSGSGSLYSDGEIAWHTKNRTGVLSQLGQSLNCGEG